MVRWSQSGEGMLMNPEEIEVCEKLGIEVCNRLTKIREEKGVSKNELSQRSGLSRSAILKIERGERRATLPTLYRIAKSLDVELWKVLKGV